MKARFFKYIFMLFVIGAGIVSITSCSNYDDEIKDLQGQVDALRSLIDEINLAIDGGAVIDKIESTSDGITITLSDNSIYTITNGANGTNGSVITIGENGNWFIDQTDTGNPASGEDGAYYYPNEDGFWYMVEKGTEEKTDQPWLPQGTITAVMENGNVTLYNVDGADGPISLGHATLSYLTLIPDFVTDETGGMPLINAAPLRIECGEVSSPVQVRYRVSPRNASKDKIDIENIYFEYNNPAVIKSKSADINAQVTFVSLENGVLTVEASFDTGALEAPGSGKIDQVMLIVPLKNGDEVNSNWAKVSATPFDIDDLAIVASPKPEEVSWEAMELPATADGAKSIEITDHRVMEMPYDGIIELSEIVDLMLTTGEWAPFDLGTYNLEYQFDLNDENGNPIEYTSGDENKDQQQYVSIAGTALTGKVSDVDGPSPAPTSRTPIVRVMVKSSGLDCNVTVGFIKFSMVAPKEDGKVINNIKVQNLPGGAKISYNLEVDAEMSHVVATYALNGDEIEEEAPVTQNFILLQGFEESKSYTVSLKAVNKDGGDYPGAKITTIHPLEIAEFDKTLFSNLNLSDDFDDPHYTTSTLENLWDDDITKYFMQKAGSIDNYPHPNWVSIDLGKKYFFSGFRVFNLGHHATGWVFRSGAVKKFALYASNTPATSDNWMTDGSWTPLGEFEVIKPSGLPVNENSAEDLAAHAAGHYFDLPLVVEGFRYVRFVNIETWDGRKNFCAMNFVFTGAAAE